MRTLSDGAEKRRRRRDRVPEGGRRGAVDAARRAVHVRARAARLARAHLGPHGRRPAHVPARPDALGPAHDGALRAARGLRPELPRRAATSPASGTRPSIARWKLERGRTRADRQLGARRRCRSRPRSGSSPRCSPTAARRSCSSRPSMRRAVAARAQALERRARAQPAPEAGGRTSLKRRALARAPTELERAAVRVGDRPREPQPEPRRARHRSRRARTGRGRPARARARRRRRRPRPRPSRRAVTSIATVEPCRSPFATRFASAWRSRVGSRGRHAGRRSTVTTTPLASAERRGRARPTSTGSVRSESSCGSETSRSTSRPAATASATQPPTLRGRRRRQRPSASASSAATGLRSSCASDAEPVARRSRARSAIRATARRGRRGEQRRRRRRRTAAPPARRRVGPCCRARRARCGAASVGRCAARRAGRAPRRARRRRARASRRARRRAARRAGAARPARRFSTPRFQGQTSWQMSQP